MQLIPYNYLRSVTVEAPLDSVPLFVKAGSIIPVMDPRIQTLNTATNESVITMKKLEVRKLIIALWCLIIRTPHLVFLM
jgi:alpha-glucosidase (family GH31 glycosyl hydrolase)